MHLAEAFGQAPYLLGQLLDWPVQRYPERVAVACPGRTYRFAELAAAVEQRVAVRREQVHPGECWGLALPNGPELLIELFALWRLGAIAAPLRLSWSRERIEAVAAQVPCAGVLWPGEPLALVQRRVTEVPLSLPKMLGVLGGQIDLDPALVLFTSGSSGEPRGTILQHHAVLANLRANCAGLGLDDDDKTLVVLPLAHAYALIHQCLCHLAIGASVFFPPTPLLGPVLCRTLEEQEISTLALVPTALGLLTDGLERTGRTCPELRLITVGAAQADQAVLLRLRELLPHTALALTYGLTEAGPRVATRFLAGELGETTCLGMPLPNVAVTEQGGSLWVRSRAQCLGYTPLPENLWESALDTSDCGTITTEGIWLTGRRGRTINRGGTLIAPEGIETVLREHPGVRSARVDPAPHSRWGVVLVASVAVVGELSEAELMRWCAERLPPEERPERVQIETEEHPHTKARELMQIFEERN